LGDDEKKERKKDRKTERMKNRKTEEKKNFGDAIRRKKETSSLNVLPKEFRNFKQFN
jgi:hypothetical protein